MVNTATTAAQLYDTNSDMELGKPLVGTNDGSSNKSTSKATTNVSWYQRTMLALDERYGNMNVLFQQWQPRVEFFVRVLLVASFVDDSFRMLTNFENHVVQVAAITLYNPTLATVAVGVGLCVQSFGALAVIANFKIRAATLALIGWTITQPFLYAQGTNLEFLAESMSLLGGLVLLRAHHQPSQDAAKHTTQFLGRLLLPSMYLYYGGMWMTSILFDNEETGSYFQYFTSLSSVLVVVLLSIGLLCGAGLVAVGLKSRLVALLLAVINLLYTVEQHPYYTYAWRNATTGEWEYDTTRMNPAALVVTATTPGEGINIDGVAEDVVLDYTELYDVHKYYFYLGVSTTGAFLLLALFGPGHHALQRHEVLLPTVQRARD